MPDKLNVASDVHRLKAVYAGLPRTRDAIFLYLEEAYRIAQQWWNRKAEVIRQIPAIRAKPLDRRISKTPARLLIELTCTGDVRLKSRYSNALSFARKHQCSVGALKPFIKNKGGLEECGRSTKRTKMT
jgi:hypothetical protein